MRGSSLDWVGVLWGTGLLKLKLLPASFLASSLDPTLESLELHLIWAFSFNDPNVLSLFLRHDLDFRTLQHSSPCSVLELSFSC